MPTIYKCKLCGKEFDEYHLTEMENHFKEEHGIKDEAEMWENIIQDFKTTGMKVEWKCTLCGRKFNNYNGILAHLIDDHNITVNDEVPLSDFIIPVVTIDGSVGEYYDDGSMYWWPIFEIIEDLIDSKLMNDKEFKKESKCNYNDEVYITHVGINIVKRIVDERPQFDLVFFLMPVCEFSVNSFKKFIDTVSEVIEKVTGVPKDKYRIYLDNFNGTYGSMFTSKSTPVLKILINLNDIKEGALTNVTG